MGVAVRNAQRQSARRALRGVLFRLALSAVAIVAVMVPGLRVSAQAPEHYALIVTGASGGQEYADKYASWRDTFARILRETLRYPDDHILLLSEQAEGRVRQATRENLRAAFAQLQQKMTANDQLLVLFIGHGVSGDEDEAKFNLVGPDVSAGELDELLKPIAGRIVFVNGASGSFPFLAKLSAKNRIIVTAAASAAQQYETVFPEYFIGAFAGLAGDIDKNGRVSIWEAFVFATDRVKRWYDEQTRLSTERALLDDNGDGIGREPQTQGPDGPVAQTTFLQVPVRLMEPSDTVLGALTRRRATLEADLDRLRANKANLQDADYSAQLEKLLVEIAQLDRQIRAEQGRK